MVLQVHAYYCGGGGDVPGFWVSGSSPCGPYRWATAKISCQFTSNPETMQQVKYANPGNMRRRVVTGLVAGMVGLALMVSARAQDSVITFARYCAATTSYSVDPGSITQLSDGTYWLNGGSYFAKADTTGKFLELYRVRNIVGSGDAIHTFNGNWWFAVHKSNGDVAAGKVTPSGIDTLWIRKYLYLPTNRYLRFHAIRYIPEHQRIYAVTDVYTVSAGGFTKALLILDTLGEPIHLLIDFDRNMYGDGDIALARDGDILVTWRGNLRDRIIMKIDPQTLNIKWVRQVTHESDGKIIQDSQTGYIWVALSGWNPFAVLVFDENGGLVAQDGIGWGGVPARPVIFRNYVVIPIVSRARAETGLFYFDRTTGSLVNNVIPVVGAQNGGLWQNPAQVILTRDSGLAMVARDANGRLVIIKTNLYGEMNGCPWTGTDTSESGQPPTITLVNVTLQDSVANLKPDTLYFTQIDQYMVLDSVDCPPTWVSNGGGTGGGGPAGLAQSVVNTDLAYIVLQGGALRVVPLEEGVHLRVYTLTGQTIEERVLNRGEEVLRLVPGFYLLELKKGGRIQTRKLIVAEY